jgi:glycosyltransferase involved in cell wall biosynthesis
MRELIILNYTMNRDHPVLSHQVDTALLLASHFEKTTVITADARENVTRSDLQVISTNWPTGNRFWKVFRLLTISLPVLWTRRKNAVVFSHMTDFQSALLGPVTKILGIKHYLWYAHKTKSTYLKFANIFVDGIITSTIGSCPIRSSKVYGIGQAVDEKTFQFHQPDSNLRLVKALHIGRLDSSKRVDLIISSIANLRNEYSDLEFTQIGSPSTLAARKASNEIVEKWRTSISDGWLRIQPTVARDELPSLIPKFDVFFHAYFGSLDKALIEATMCGIPVVTLNPEYLLEFGSWGSQQDMTLESEYSSIVTLDHDRYVAEVQRRYRISVDRHSRAKWIESVVEILMGAKRTTDGRDS